MSASWKGGSTRAWRVLRARVLARDGWLCQIQLPGEWVTARGQTRRCLVRADCVHHTSGKEHTGDDPQFLKAACTPCNLKMGDVVLRDPAPRPMTRW